MKLIVTAPGTTANIGPGYDCLGLALTLYSTFTFEPSDVLMIEGCDEAYRNADNFVIKGFAAVYRRVGKQMPPVHLTIEAGIPIARGLGSSSVCFVSGAFAANSFLGEPFSRDELFQLCSAFEGHPRQCSPQHLRRNDGVICRERRRRLSHTSHADSSRLALCGGDS